MNSMNSFLKNLVGPTKQIDTGIGASALTLRYAVPADAEALDRLAELDSRRTPRGLVLVAEIGGELWAAISLDDHHAVADPFRPTSELVLLLNERARQIKRRNRGRLHGLPRVWPEGNTDRVALG
jgi:hypothetical protein